MEEKHGGKRNAEDFIYHPPKIGKARGSEIFWVPK